MALIRINFMLGTIKSNFHKKVTSAVTKRVNSVHAVP